MAKAKKSKAKSKSKSGYDGYEIVSKIYVPKGIKPKLGATTLKGSTTKRKKAKKAPKSSGLSGSRKRK